jgi:hypothetical protein
MIVNGIFVTWNNAIHTKKIFLIMPNGHMRGGGWYQIMAKRDRYVGK